MQKILGLLSLLLCCFSLATAQQLQGIVYDLETSQVLSDVKIENLNNHQKTSSDLQGKFTIQAGINDYLTFDAIGYQADTAFIYQEGVNRIYLVRDQATIRIDEVVVSKITDSRLTKELEKAKWNAQVTEVSKTQGGIRISPSRIFGREAKNARSAIEILQIEQQQRQVGRVFNNELILSLIPMSKEEIALFKAGYSPSFEFIRNASKADLSAYIIEAYAKFKKDNPSFR